MDRGIMGNMVWVGDSDGLCSFMCNRTDKKDNI